MLIVNVMKNKFEILSILVFILLLLVIYYINVYVYSSSVENFNDKKTVNDKTVSTGKKVLDAKDAIIEARKSIQQALGKLFIAYNEVYAK